MIDVNRIKSMRRLHKNIIGIYFKISKELSDWLKEKGYSSKAIFWEACKELGFTPNQGGGMRSKEVGEQTNGRKPDRETGTGTKETINQV